MNKPIFLFFLLALGLAACGTDTPASETEIIADDNPPAAGFDAAGSDARAIELADSVMVALGGRRAWDNTRYLGWNFFGSRKLLWDKHEQRVRIESLRDSSIYLVDLQNLANSKINHQGQVLTHADSIAKYAKRAEGMWINDSYWLVMPFKLKDSGVTLKHLGSDSTQAGTSAEVLQLTFRDVGNTPQNKYLVYVDTATYLPVQWDYYAEAQADTARFSSPWEEYRRFGNILLSGKRGQRGITEIAVYEEVPAAAFESLEPVDW